MMDILNMRAVYDGVFDGMLLGAIAGATGLMIRLAFKAWNNLIGR